MSFEVHIKKSIAPYFQNVRQGSFKTFEIRLDDCRYKQGDIIVQREYNPTTDEYSGDYTVHRIGFLTNFEQKKGYVVFSLKEAGLDGYKLAVSALMKVLGVWEGKTKSKDES